MKRTVVLVTMALIMASFTGCGTKTETASQKAVTAESNSEAEQETEQESETEESTSSQSEAEEQSIKEETERFAIYKMSMEDIEKQNKIDMGDFQFFADAAYTIENDVEVYNNGTDLVTGYLKAGSTVALNDGNREWVRIIQEETKELPRFLMMRREEFEAALPDDAAIEIAEKDLAIAEEEKEEAPSKEESQPTSPADNGGSNGGSNEQPTPAPEPTPVPTPTPEPTPIPEPTAPEPAPELPAAKYSDDEVIGVVESTFRSAGFVKPTDLWDMEFLEGDPTAGMGWGESNISNMNPRVDAQSLLDGLNAGGYNMYYIEQVGSVPGGITIRLYRGTYQ